MATQPSDTKEKSSLPSNKAATWQLPQSRPVPCQGRGPVRAGAGLAEGRDRGRGRSAVSAIYIIEIHLHAFLTVGARSESKHAGLQEVTQHSNSETVPTMTSPRADDIMTFTPWLLTTNINTRVKVTFSDSVWHFTSVNNKDQNRQQRWPTC